ncbi:MAG TPA: tetratricopeptide repeat protein [Gemmatimonas sp.]|uniref:tetratricopeptide repeat protein n=1 Tax=Gemmatimonas sp. TaxID=1962908 RepID=UPI002ED9C670
MTDAIANSMHPQMAERLAALQQVLQALQAPDTPASAVDAAERERLKQEIIGLFRDADAAVKEAQALKDAVKGLVEQWKLVERQHGVSAPVAATAPSPVVSGRVDHLGASTFIEKGWSRLSLGDLESAETALRRALELAPGSNDAETLLGWTQMLNGQLEAALASLQAVLRRDAGHALARANVGYVRWRQGHHGEAIEHLAAVVRADSDRKATLYAHLYLGMVYGDRAMYADAERFLKGALERGPNLLQGWYELGRVYWFDGRRADAMAAWKSGADANKFSPWGKRCAELLELVNTGGAPSREY